MRAEAGGEAVWGVSHASPWGFTVRSPWPRETAATSTDPEASAASVFHARKHQQTIQAKCPWKDGAPVKSQIYLPEMICVKQQSQRLLFFFSLLLLFFFCCCADGALSHRGRCENTLEQIPRLGMSAVSSSQIGLSDYQTLL